MNVEAPLTGTITDDAYRIMAERYFASEREERSPTDVFRRVSNGNNDYFQLMDQLLFLPNSPTLFNMGLNNGCTNSACFVFDVDDTMLGDIPGEVHPSSIMGTQEKAAAVAKAGGGVGYFFGKLRPRGAPIRSVHRQACGPVAVLRHYHSIRNLIRQGARRDLAQMGVLNVDHPDIMEWTTCKVPDPKALESFNISNSWRNCHMEAVFNDEHFTRIWWAQCQAAWACGCPGMFFWDTVNDANPTPHIGDVNAPNPCGETPNISDEPCNLGSIAVCRFLKRFGRTWTFAWDLMRDYAKLCIRFLDDILDWNTFPHPDIERAALTTRKLGLGVMGWADALAIMGVPYDSQEAVDIGGELMATINMAAREESVALADRKGPYIGWHGASEATKAKFPYARNATRTSIAPTGTISIIAGVYSSIEPYFGFDVERTTNEGIKLSDGVPEWVRKLIPNGFTPKTAEQIPWQWHVKHQAAFQKSTDLGVSKTINLPNSATVQDFSDLYYEMWRSGCKGGTAYRDGCREEQVLVDRGRSVYSTGHVAVKLPSDLPQLPRHRFRIGELKCYLHIGTSQDGARPLEIFLTASKTGTTMQGLLSTWAMAFSNALQSGTPLQQLVDLHSGAQFEPCGQTDNPELPVCSSVPDYVVRYLALKFGAEQKGFSSGMVCPDCSSQMIRDGGCLLCRACGFSRCG